MPAAALPLAGLRVLELGHIVAGLSAGLLLADLGADVVKVERPDEGDQSRTMPFAPLRRPDQLVDDPHLKATGQLLDTPLPGRGTARRPKLPLRSTAFEMGLRRAAPRLGEHTREVLAEIGLARDELDALASRRVIG